MMRFNDFVKALIECGWRPALDAQHTEVRALWERMFPVLAAVEKELFDAECKLDDHDLFDG
jgi:hypothetical protein